MSRLSKGIAVIATAAAFAVGGCAAPGPVVVGCPAGPPAGGGPPPVATIPGISTTVAPVDTSTSEVLAAAGSPTIQCGRVPLDSHGDVTYAPGLRLDLLVAADGAAHPLVVYLPGGGFVMAGKEGALDRRTYVAEAGFAVASIQYRTTATGATYTDAVADAKAAIRFLRAHAAEYRVDPARVAVWGESAGGYLAAMVGTTSGATRFETGENLDQSSDVQAVVDLFGPSHLAGIAADFDAATQDYYALPGNTVAQWIYGPGTTRSVVDDPQAVAAADPATYVDGTDPAFLLLHGTADVVVSPSQTLALHTALTGAGVPSTRLVIEGGNHGDLAFLNDPVGAQRWSSVQVMDRITGFITEQLRG